MTSTLQKNQKKNPCLYLFYTTFSVCVSQHPKTKSPQINSIHSGINKYAVCNVVARVLLVVGCLLFRRDHFSLHVAEGASDKTDAFTLRVRVTALAAENPKHDTSSAPFTDFTHSGFSLFSV